MSNSQRFVLIGPHQGKTMTVNGHAFVEGEYTYYGNSEQTATLTKVFANYAAVPEHEAELMELRAMSAKRVEIAKAVVAQADNGPSQAEVAAAQVAAEAAEADALMAAEAEALAKAQAEAETARLLSAAPGDAPGGLPTLAEAIGALDPENDVHWTSNNLPSLDHLATLTGRKPARGDVDAIAEGYTRAKARTARAA